jgi:heme exporter protein B
MTLSHIVAIVKKEATIELRRKHALFGIFLFAIVLVYLIYKSFNRVEGLQWDVLLWIIVLFSGINAIAKSFSQESDASRLYYYTLFDAQEVIMAKTIYNFVFIVVIFMLVFGGFSFFIENPIKDFGLFFKGAILGCLGLSVLFTFISSVSGQSGANNSMLMSIMSIPLTIPIVLLLIKTTAVAMRLIQDSSVNNDLIMLLAIDMLLMGSMFILFGELWKD